jgi:hypothetical protein
LYWECITKAYGSAETLNNLGWGPSCTQDSDCADFGVKCDLEKRACAVTRTWQEETFIRCIFDQMTPLERDWIILSNNLPSYDNSSFVAAVAGNGMSVSI